jgi:hypothetical protein
MRHAALAPDSQGLGMRDPVLARGAWPSAESLVSERQHQAPAGPARL